MAADLLRRGLDLLFCGYNPSLISGQTGHHYAHPSNRFWRVLFASGITDRLYAPQEDARLLDFGIGFTKMDPYSEEDLCRKIVKALERGMPKIEAARTFSVGVSSVKRYVATYREGRSLTPSR